MKSINLFFFVALSFFTLNSCNKDKDPVVSETTSVKFYKPALSLAVGGREKIMLTLHSMDAVLENAKWSSSDTTIVKVDGNGVVKAITAGDATISLSASNSISGKCSIKVIQSPLKNLVMPDAKYAIAKDAIVFLQGGGFTKNSKIILRSHTDYKSTLKSASDEGDILAQINDQASNYLSFSANVNSGWYNIVLDENGQQFDLGNMEVETPNISEYVYDKTKSFWEDTHWRLFQLRGKVKEMKVGGNTYLFNKNGYLETCIDWYSHKANYKYDNYNRLISKSEDCQISYAKSMVDHSTTEFSYDNHSLFLPINLDLFVQFEPSFYISLYKNGNEYPFNMYNIEMYQKGLIGIKSVMHYTSGITETANCSIDVTDNRITSSISYNYFGGVWTNDYIWQYKSQVPFDMIHNYGTKTPMATESEKYNFSSNLMPISKETTNEVEVISVNYIQNCPFMLYSSYRDFYTLNGRVGYDFKCDYDKNWNIIKFTTSDLEIRYTESKFYYMSYDNEGNWTQCIVVNKDNMNSNNIYKLTREITYW